LDDGQVRYAMRDEQDLGIEGPARRALLAEQVVREVARKELEAALRVAIRETEQQARRAAHRQRHEASDWGRLRRASLRALVPLPDVHGAWIRRPDDMIELVDPQLVVRVKHHQ